MTQFSFQNFKQKPFQLHWIWFAVAITVVIHRRSIPRSLYSNSKHQFFGVKNGVSVLVWMRSEMLEYPTLLIFGIENENLELTQNKIKRWFLIVSMPKLCLKYLALLYIIRWLHRSSHRSPQPRLRDILNRYPPMEDPSGSISIIHSITSEKWNTESNPADVNGHTGQPITPN